MLHRRAAVRLADQYVATGNVSAVVLAGSLGRGRADRFSDVELDVYWTDPPSDGQRTAPTVALGGEVTRIWPYDAADAEWAEDVTILDVDITVSGFARAEIDRWIASLAGDDVDLHLVRQLRLSALQEGMILYGEDLVHGWRAASRYPRSLAIATAVSFLTPARLNRWRLREALLQRGDLVMLHRACADVTEVVLGALSAVNRVYIEHPQFKWSRQLAGRFSRAPAAFADRLFAALATGTAESVPELHALLTETIKIIETDLPEIDTTQITHLLETPR